MSSSCNQKRKGAGPGGGVALGLWQKQHFGRGDWTQRLSRLSWLGSLSLGMNTGKSNCCLSFLGCLDRSDSDTGSRLSGDCDFGRCAGGRGFGHYERFGGRLGGLSGVSGVACGGARALRGLGSTWVYLVHSHIAGAFSHLTRPQNPIEIQLRLGVLYGWGHFGLLTTRSRRRCGRFAPCAASTGFSLRTTAIDPPLAGGPRFVRFPSLLPLAAAEWPGAPDGPHCLLARWLRAWLPRASFPSWRPSRLYPCLLTDQPHQPRLQGS